MVEKRDGVPDSIIDESTKILYQDLLEVNAPDRMLLRCRKDIYNDYKSPHADNMAVLMSDAKQYNLPKIVEGVLDGKYDGTLKESAEWANSDEGVSAFTELLSGKKKND